ncbi:hypothetical protein IAG44_17775 [Streptomyces roseirectus]|uniref:Uncharacterized protein n=1 Tax=Streptomyces roseirectus TaxID=2768066 RepID=A0A7H0IE88_9ACTN|nr:hypothetical protein [Streptomyces roseirectus]QNP71104.1 hypothetical protein IAG44_17775 [Streptomyces roseirectus]
MPRPGASVPAANRTRLAWGPVGWELTSGDPAEHRWFTEHLSVTEDHLPYAEPLRTFRIEVRTGTAAEWWTGRAGRTGQTADGPVVRIRDVLHHRTTIEGYPAWVPADGAYAYVHRGGNDWLVLRDDRGPNRFRPAETLAAELLNVTLTELGGTTIHASAATAPHATLFAGASGTGKTTLALALAARGGAFIAGDRSILLPGDNHWHIAGAAVAARFAPGTLHATGHAERVYTARLLRHAEKPLREDGRLPGHGAGSLCDGDGLLGHGERLLRDGARPLRDGGGLLSHGDELPREGDTPSAPSPPSKALLTQTELHRLLHTPTSAGAPLTRIALLEPTTTKSPTATRIPPNETPPLLHPHLLPPPTPWWHPSPPPPPLLPPCPPAPTFRLRWNPTTHSAETALRVLDEAEASERG